MLQLHSSYPSKRCCRALGRMDELSLETGPLITDVYKGGAIVTHRTDLLIGGSGSSPGAVTLWQLLDHRHAAMLSWQTVMVPCHSYSVRRQDRALKGNDCTRSFSHGPVSV